MKSVDEQLALIRRGVDQIVPEAELRTKLERSVRTGVPLRVKYGIDPTGIDVHLGHTVPLRKLRLFQDLGHQAVLIIGNYTALVGDPSGRDQARSRLTEEQVEANARDYLAQVKKVIDIDKTEVHSNGDWFGRFRFLDVLALTTKIMSIPDELMREWFELLTDRSPDEVTGLLLDPMNAKKTLAKDIISFYYGLPAAEEAADEWRRRFSERQDPTAIPEKIVPPSE